MKVANVAVKCPICGESKYIQSLGRVKLDGLDPLMEKFICKRESIEWEKDDFKVKRRYCCDTVFYVAPTPKFRDKE
ncbi:MAG: hypothetical protein PHU23_08715 [Dehalococcoidales bacterium]|nr:hypothetical protein [Dehalococcoidales bacterium]